MIKVKVKYNENFIDSFVMSGHSDYDVSGKDIVCASASSIAISSVNLASKFDESAIDVICKDGFLDVKILKKDEIINKVFINMIDMLKELEVEYKKNIKII